MSASKIKQIKQQPKIDIRLYVYCFLAAFFIVIFLTKVLPILIQLIVEFWVVLLLLAGGYVMVVRPLRQED
jgi:hypothetical protein